jgi:uncharacterized membrane protein YjdF
MSAALACNLALLVGLGLVVPGVAPFERGTWLLEIFGAIAMPLLWFTRRRFR